MSTPPTFERLEAYLRDIAFAAAEAVTTTNPTVRADCVRVLSEQVRALADLSLKLDMERTDRKTHGGHFFDFA